MVFPSPPHTLNDPHTEAGVTWYWDGQKWKRTPTVVSDAYVNLGEPNLPSNTVSGNKIPSPGSTDTQLDLNQWTTLSLGVVDNLFDANGDFIGEVHYGSTEPLVLNTGTLWFNTNSDTLLIYDGASWVNTTKPVSQGVSEPGDKSNGDLWFDTTAEQLFVYNGSTTTWVATGPSAKLTDTVTDLDTTVDDLVTKVGELEGEVDGLKVEKGSLKKYDIFNLSGLPASRPGEMAASSADPTLVTTLSINPIAKDGTPSNLIAAGDIIEIEVSGNVAKYLVSDWDSNTGYGLVTFSQASTGMPDFVLTEEVNIFTYPQNGLSASVEYVDNAVANFVPKTGGTFTGKIYVEDKGDDARFYLKDSTGTNLTLFPSGLIQSKNTVRVNKDSGDCYQVKDSSGSTVKWKVTSDGNMEAPRVRLMGGGSATKLERVIDVKSGHPGRLAYDGSSRIIWGSASVWFGTSSSAGDTAKTITMNFQNNPITNVSSLGVKHQGSAAKKFVITGETADKQDDDNFFYSYKNSAGTLDAMNYKGKMDSENNLVNKKYVDDKVNTMGGFLPGDRVAVSGGNSSAKNGGLYYTGNKLFYKV